MVKAVIDIDVVALDVVSADGVPSMVIKARPSHRW
jgi:hypothetical protein